MIRIAPKAREKNRGFALYSMAKPLQNIQIAPQAAEKKDILDCIPYQNPSYIQIAPKAREKKGVLHCITYQNLQKYIEIAPKAREKIPPQIIITTNQNPQQPSSAYQGGIFAKGVFLQGFPLML